jgi:hypothetical protein
MRVNIAFFLFILVGSAAVYSQTGTGPVLHWSDATRDVYIDNELDRGAQVLTTDSPSRLALISAKLDSAVVLDITERTASTILKNAFQFGADRATATTQSIAEMKPAGKFTRVDGPIYFFVIDGKPVLIRAHPGASGEMTLEKLWETVPVWRSMMTSYEPNPQAVQKIKADDKATTVTLAFGTWCPDSKNYVPKLIKALRAAANDKIQLRLVGVDNQFREPVDTVQPRRITNVPTVIVERGGREIGRIVETPAASTIEEDLASILSGKLPPHNGRWDRGSRLAKGVYAYRNRTGEQVGTEEWQLFNTAEGGFLVHSRITIGDLKTEVFHRVDANRRPSFAEVTKLHGDDRVRTRINIDGKTMTARTRGSVSGVILQTLEVPERFILSSPAIAARGFEQSADNVRYQTSGYLEPQEFDNVAGALVALSCETRGEETVSVPAGEFRARRVMRKTDGGTAEWWVHSKLGIPVKGLAGGIEFVLASLEDTTGK